MDKIIELLAKNSTHARSVGIIALIYFAQTATTDLSSIKVKIAHIETVQEADHQTVQKLEDVFFRRGSNINLKETNNDKPSPKI